MMVLTVCFSLLILDNIRHSANDNPTDRNDISFSDNDQVLPVRPAQLSSAVNDSVTAKTTKHGTVYKNPVNPLMFDYMINPGNMCRGLNLSLIIYVHSAPKNVKKRQAIRETWGDQSLMKEFRARLVFVLGVDVEAKIMNALRLESSQYSDIVQENYLDSYRNLTFKALSAIKWVSTFCGNAEFVLKSDDDILVNLFQVSHYMDAIRNNPSTSHGVILCNLWTKMAVMRNNKSKWYIPKDEFPLDYFPPYCSGSAFLFTSDVVQTLYNVSFGTPFFWVDDYFLTGLLMQKTNFRYLKMNRMYALNPHKVVDIFLSGKIDSIMFSHVQGTTNMYLLWRAMYKHYRGNQTSTFNWTEILKKQKATVVRT